MAWLEDHAPSTGSAFVPPEDSAAVEALAVATGLEPPAELRAWWAVCGGTADLAFAEVLPPFFFSTPLDVANACLYLASDEASLVSGVCIEVDGARCV